MPFFFLYSLISFFPLFLQGCSFYSYHTFFFPSPTVRCSSFSIFSCFHLLLSSAPSSYLLLLLFLSLISSFSLSLLLSTSFSAPCFPPSPPSSLTSFVLIPTPLLPFVSASHLLLILISFMGLFLFPLSLLTFSLGHCFSFSFHPSFISSPLFLSSFFNSFALILFFLSSFFALLCFVQYFLSFPILSILLFLPLLISASSASFLNLHYSLHSRSFPRRNIPRQRVFCTADSYGKIFFELLRSPLRELPGVIPSMDRPHSNINSAKKRCQGDTPQ